MSSLDANDLKTKGISAIEVRLKVDEEVVISVRGQDRYVIMDLEKYNKLREYELVVVAHEARADMSAERFVTESVVDHMRRIDDAK